MDGCLVGFIWPFRRLTSAISKRPRRDSLSSGTAPFRRPNMIGCWRRPPTGYVCPGALNETLRIILSPDRNRTIVKHTIRLGSTNPDFAGSIRMQQPSPDEYRTSKHQQCTGPSLELCCLAELQVEKLPGCFDARRPSGSRTQARYAMRWSVRRS
jgi:hypothetical protein